MKKELIKAIVDAANNPDLDDEDFGPDCSFMGLYESDLVSKFGKPVNGKWVIETYEAKVLAPEWCRDDEEYVDGYEIVIPSESTVTIHADYSIPYCDGRLYHVEGDFGWLSQVLVDENGENLIITRGWNSTPAVVELIEKGRSADAFKLIANGV